MRRLVLACSCLALSNTLVSAGSPYQKIGPRIRAAVAELDSGVAPNELRARGRCVCPRGRLDVFIVGSVSWADLDALDVEVRTRTGRIRTAYVPRTSLADVAALPEVERLVGAVRGTPALDLATPAVGAHALRGPGPGFTGLNGEGILVGDVDSGVDLSHGDFQNPDGSTRLVAVWDQSDSLGPNPAGYPYGSEWTAANIDAGISRQVDDNGHGTPVLAAAAGDGSATGGGEPAFQYVGIAPRADLAMVKAWPNYYTTDVVDGVAYIFGLADTRGQDAVVNLSLSYRYGPHDGTSTFETMLDALTGPGRIICASAGNWRGLPVHAEVTAQAPENEATLEVSGSGLGAYFWVDAYYDTGDTLAVTVRTPLDDIIGPVVLGSENAAWPGDSTSAGFVWVFHDSSYSTVHPEVYVYVSAGSSGQNVDGTWSLTFDPVSPGSETAEVDLWQADSGLNVAFVKGLEIEEEMVSEPATAHHVIGVGGWSTRPVYEACNGDSITIPGLNTPPGTLYSQSNPGPSRDGRIKPEVVAPAVWVHSALSHDASDVCPPPGTNTGILPDLEHRASLGTSLAAPIVSGAAALLLQSQGSLTPAQIRSYLTGRAVADTFTGNVPNNDWGYGKLWIGDLTTVGVGIPDVAGAGWPLDLSPNPSAGSFRISLGLDRVPTAARLAVYDVRGRRVADLTDEMTAASSGGLRWDPSLPAGTYFVRFEALGRATTRRVTVLR